MGAALDSAFIERHHQGIDFCDQGSNILHGYTAPGQSLGSDALRIAHRGRLEHSIRIKSYNNLISCYKLGHCFGWILLDIRALPLVEVADGVNALYHPLTSLSSDSREGLERLFKRLSLPVFPSAESSSTFSISTLRQRLSSTPSPAPAPW